MKRTLTLIACVAVCCSMMASCKNANTAEPTPEEIQAQKVALADSALAEIDSLAEQYFDATSKSFRISAMELTDGEKLVKPDYLLEPSVAATFVTKVQKVNALAIYSMELGVRKIYDMPQEETREVVARLAAELNHPIDVGLDTTIVVKIKSEYEKCKERGDLAYFWQFQYALVTEISYILAHNPDLYFSKITGDQWRSFCVVVDSKLNAVKKLAEYDEEMAQIIEFRNKYRVTDPSGEKERIDHSIETVKNFHIANKDKFVAKRNALLQ